MRKNYLLKKILTIGYDWLNENVFLLSAKSISHENDYREEKKYSPVYPQQKNEFSAKPGKNLIRPSLAFVFLFAIVKRNKNTLSYSRYMPDVILLQIFHKKKP